jgi:hypothetical protein
MCNKRSTCVLFAILSGGVVALAGLGGSYEVPLDHDAIQYTSRPVADPIAKLQQSLSSGDITLDFDEKSGYLPAVLKALGVPRESQVLVFSKTSFQAPHIFPRVPRAIYFNDGVSVGWVRNGDVLEVASVDPKQGVIFYTLDQQQVAKPQFERRDTCLQCHINGATLGVPGIMVRSVHPDKYGMPLFAAGSFVTDHRSPFKERWGGWYVSGTHGSQVHMGNTFGGDRSSGNMEGTQNVTDLGSFLDTAAYLTPHSDIIALMALEHQTHTTNLITRVGFETRLALHDSAAIKKALGEPEDELSESATRRINNAVEELLAYMLFTQETRLTEPVRGVSEFSQVFARSGPRDRKGRSLRDLDLRTRLLRYPCSYLIYSEAFDQLPEIARERLYRRLWEVLTGRDTTEKFATLSAKDREAIFEILRDTKKGLPDYWRNRTDVG